MSMGGFNAQGASHNHIYELSLYPKKNVLALGATFVVFGVYGILRAHEIVQKQTTIDGDVKGESTMNPNDVFRKSEV